MCKGAMNDKLASFMVDVDNCIIIVKNVPSQVCGQCGEISYDHDTAVELEKIVKSLRATVTEIAVVNYQDEVA